MFLHALTTKAALLVALTFALPACGEEKPATSPAFPTGNAMTLGDCEKLLRPAAPRTYPNAKTAADCEKLPDPKPLNDHPMDRATAASTGFHARSACKTEVAKERDKPSVELVRICQSKWNEYEKKRASGRKITDKELFEDMKKAAAALPRPNK